jgi:uncharacterized coiled-coil protein SlyX
MENQEPSASTVIIAELNATIAEQKGKITDMSRTINSQKQALDKVSTQLEFLGDMYNELLEKVM